MGHSNQEYLLSRDPSIIGIIHKPSSIVLTERNFRLREAANLLIDRNAKGAIVETEAAVRWLKWPMHETAAKVVYEPRKIESPRQLGDGSFNLWQGWGIDKADPDGNAKLFEKLLDHLLSDTPEPEAKKAFIQWLAYPFQNPSAKINWGVILYGVTEGSGKTLLAYTLRGIYGDANFMK